MTDIPPGVTDLASAARYIETLPGVELKGLTPDGRLDIIVTGQLTHDVQHVLIAIGKLFGLNGHADVPIIGGISHVQAVTGPEVF